MSGGGMSGVTVRGDVLHPYISRHLYKLGLVTITFFLIVNFSESNE